MRRCRLEAVTGLGESGVEQLRSNRKDASGVLRFKPSSFSGFLGLVLLACLLPVIQAQEVGVDICGCQPARYEMTLQFNLTCADRTVHEDSTAGVDDTTCVIQDRVPNNILVANFQPARIENVQIFELDQDQDGEMLSYHDP